MISPFCCLWLNHSQPDQERNGKDLNIELPTSNEGLTPEP